MELGFRTGASWPVECTPAAMLLDRLASSKPLRSGLLLIIVPYIEARFSSQIHTLPNGKVEVDVIAKGVTMHVSKEEESTDQRLPVTDQTDENDAMLAAVDEKYAKVGRSVNALIQRESGEHLLRRDEDDFLATVPENGLSEHGQVGPIADDESTWTSPICDGRTREFSPEKCIETVYAEEKRYRISDTAAESSSLIEAGCSSYVYVPSFSGRSPQRQDMTY